MNHYNIRLVEKKDAQALRDIYAYYVEQTYVSFEYAAPSATEFWERIEATIQEFPWLVSTCDEKIIGYAYAHKHRVRDAYQWSPESTIYLSSDFQTKGIGRILYETLFNLLRLQGYHTVFAGVALPNDKSIGIHQRMGFEPIGVFKNVGFKNGKWHDTSWFQLSLQQIAGEPKAPIKLPEIQSSPEWIHIINNANQQLSTINHS
jgi:L-amino acid N-acyltransferase YncA